MVAVTSTKKQRVRGRPFPKGVSGNPKGRKKGSTEWSEIKKVFRRVFFDVGGEEKLKAMCETNSGFREFSKYLIAIMPREVEGGGGPAIINIIYGHRENTSAVEGRTSVVKQV